MDQQNKQEGNDQQSVVEDLPVSKDQTPAVKGGPFYLHVTSIEGEATGDGTYSKPIQL